MFLLIGTLTMNAQDILVATHYTDNGKVIHKLTKPRHYILQEVQHQRTEFKLVDGKDTVIDAYVTRCELVETKVTASTVIRIRQIVAISRKDNTTEHKYLLTVVFDRATETPLKFIITTLTKDQAGRAYLGKII